MTLSAESIPYGACKCGCGNKTRISHVTDRSHGWVKGVPRSYISGHTRTKQRPTLMQDLAPNVMKIPLTNGFITTVSEEDYDELSKYLWMIRRDGYAGRGDKHGNVKTILMHRKIIGAMSGQYVDHIDGDKLNNVRSNLRLCTNSQNGCNRGPQTGNKSGYKGVSWCQGAWVSQIVVNGVYNYLGRHKEKEKAALAYNEAALRLHGEFAVLNEVENA